MSVNYTDFEQIPLVISVTQLARILGIGKNTAYGLDSQRKYQEYPHWTPNSDFQICPVGIPEL